MVCSSPWLDIAPRCTMALWPGKLLSTPLSSWLHALCRAELSLQSRAEPIKRIKTIAWLLYKFMMTVKLIEHCRHTSKCRGPTINVTAASCYNQHTAHRRKVVAGDYPWLRIPTTHYVSSLLEFSLLTTIYDHLSLGVWLTESGLFVSIQYRASQNTWTQYVDINTFITFYDVEKDQMKHWFSLLSLYWSVQGWGKENKAN